MGLHDQLLCMPIQRRFTSGRLFQGEGEPVQLAGKVSGRTSFRGLGILAVATTKQERSRVIVG